MSLERNIIVEDNFDFWKELNDDEDNNKIIYKNLCELTREPLTENYITLPCGHKFNYKPLCIEICTLKDPKNVKSMTRYLGSRRICCPYCRQVFNKLLPIIPTIDVGLSLPKYVASTTNCIEHKKCMYIYKSGSKKGTMCSCNGFDCNGTSLCMKHWKAAEKKKAKKPTNHKSKKRYTKNDLTGKALELFNKYKVNELKSLLKNKKALVGGNKATLAERLSKLNI